MAAYLDGSLDGPDRAVLESHVVRCSRCRSAVADAARSALLSTATPSAASEGTGHIDAGPRIGGLPEPGDVIADKYVVERTLGSGSMGWVVAAHHRDLGQRVAIKVFRRTAAGTERRFLAEARTSAQLSHPNIPRVFDFGRLPDGTPYMVMEYLVGRDLGATGSDGPMAIDAAVRYIIQACAGLAVVHAAGIIHRDLKPANLFLATGPGGETTVKVLDFGISKAVGPWTSGASAGLTSTGVAVGSPLYMSPEQLRARRDVDRRSDIWSLGVILYELTTGQPPFRGPGLPALAVSIAVDSPERPSALRREIPLALEEIILRCLAKAPAQRYATVADLTRDLAALCRTEPPFRRRRITLRASSGKLVAAVIITGLLAAGASLCAGLGGLAGTAARPTRAPGESAARRVELPRPAASAAPAATAAPEGRTIGVVGDVIPHARAAPAASLRNRRRAPSSLPSGGTRTVRSGFGRERPAKARLAASAATLVGPLDTPD